MTKKSLYDTLGVNSKASDAEISKAYKDKAKELHPDKGGDKEAMTELNQAYMVLKNPARRSRYDSTGETQETPFDVKFAELVTTTFIKIIEVTPNVESCDMVGRFSEMVSEYEKEGLKVKKDLSAKLVKLEKVLGRIQGGEKIKLVIEGNIADIKRHIASVEENIEFMQKAQDVINNSQYQFE